MEKAKEVFKTIYFEADIEEPQLDDVDKEAKKLFLESKLELFEKAGFSSSTHGKRIEEELKQLSLSEEDLPSIGKKIDFNSKEGSLIYMAFPLLYKLMAYQKDVPYDVVRLIAENREDFSDFYIREPRSGRAKLIFKEFDFDPLLFGVAKSDGQHYLLAQWGKERTIKLKSIRTRQRWGKVIRKILLEGMLVSPLIMATLLTQFTNGVYHNYWWLLLFCFAVAIPIRACIRYFPTPFRSFFFRTGEKGNKGSSYRGADYDVYSK